jgi:hypothetical protein
MIVTAPETWNVLLIVTGWILHFEI